MGKGEKRRYPTPVRAASGEAIYGLQSLGRRSKRSWENIENLETCNSLKRWMRRLPGYSVSGKEWCTGKSLDTIGPPLSRYCFGVSFCSCCHFIIITF